MAPSKNNQLIFERRRKEHNIVFVEDLPQSRRPSSHANVFEAIDKIKSISYNSYGCEDNEQEPWKKEAKCQTRRLTAKAGDCIAGNEPTWRLACEPLVFSRLTSEVACKNCRRRVWRSEIEAALNPGDRAAEQLRARQETRDRCRCPRNTRPEDEDERIGLNRLFIDRADDLIEHPPCLAEQLPQEQRPDRIYGLRQTRNFENLLLTSLESGEYVEDKLARQPHGGVGGEPLLFPFLVVEAKSGSAPDDWPSICLQTCFPIYTYLNTQKSLIDATGQNSRWSSGPLVWFFASRGQDWRLYLAYQSPMDSGSTSKTTTLAQAWGGCITNRDDAIQLVLIVDYLADWARDIYRPAILTELRILQSPDEELATVFTDTDIFSTGDLNFAVDSPSNFGDEYDINSTFKTLDSNMGAVRHIRPIETRFMSLIITADNVQTLLMFMTPGVRRTSTRKVLDALHSPENSCELLGIDRIDAIERVWTGCSRLSTVASLKGSKFYTAHRTLYYLSANFDQVRDLSLLAVAEDVLDILINESGLKAGRGKARKPSLATSENGDLFDLIASIKNAPPRHNLLACIHRCVGYLSRDSPNSFIPSNKLLWELVNSTYRFRKRGELELDLPFMRVSKCLDMQTEQEGYQGPLMVENALHVSQEGAVLIHGGRSPQIPSVPWRERTKVCVYLVRENQPVPTQAALAHIIKTTYENYEVYHTSRQSLYKRVKTCNLEDSYGVFFDTGSDEESFVHWGKTLPGDLIPQRQGSPRGPANTGQIMFDREYFPFHESSLTNGLSFKRERNTFIKDLIREEATAWTNIARNKRAQGITCCAYCARGMAIVNHESFDDSDNRRNMQLPDVCRTCTRALDQFESLSSPNRVTTWIKHALETATSANKSQPSTSRQITSPHDPSALSLPDDSDFEGWSAAPVRKARRKPKKQRKSEDPQLTTVEELRAEIKRADDRARLHMEYNQKLKRALEGVEEEYAKRVRRED